MQYWGTVGPSHAETKINGLLAQGRLGAKPPHSFSELTPFHAFESTLSFGTSPSKRPLTNFDRPDQLLLVMNSQCERSPSLGDIPSLQRDIDCVFRLDPSSLLSTYVQGRVLPRNLQVMGHWR